MADWIKGCLGQGEKKGDGCLVVCGACRTELCRIRATHQGVTDDEFEALRERIMEGQTPMKRSHVRALHKSNAQRERESEWPMLSVRIPSGIMQGLDELAADRGCSKAEVVRSLLVAGSGGWATPPNPT